MIFTTKHCSSGPVFKGPSSHAARGSSSAADTSHVEEIAGEAKFVHCCRRSSGSPLLVCRKPLPKNTSPGHKNRYTHPYDYPVFSER